MQSFWWGTDGLCYQLVRKSVRCRVHRLGDGGGGGNTQIVHHATTNRRMEK